MINILNDKDYEIAEIIQKFGARRPTALALTIIKDGEEHTSVEIERAADIRQPEVSIAMTELLSKGIVDVREEHKTGKGRPVKVYKLNVPFEDIIKGFEGQLHIKTTDDRDTIAKLRSLVAS